MKESLLFDPLLTQLCVCVPTLLLPLDFQLVYATATSVYMLVFAQTPPLKKLLLSTTEDLESFDIDWRSGSILWTNGTGHLKGQWLSGGESVHIPTPGPGKEE